MRVLALDLGFLNTGFSVINKNTIETIGVIAYNHKKFTLYVNSNKEEFETDENKVEYQNEKIKSYLFRLLEITDNCDVLSNNNYDCIVAETTFFGAQSYKAAIYMAISATFWILKYPNMRLIQPQKVKKLAKQQLGVTKVSKLDIINWINEIYTIPDDINKIPKGLHNHIYDSLAAYVTYINEVK